MTKAKLTSKGQITLPKDVPTRLGLWPGDEIEFIEDTTGFRLKKRMADHPVKKYRGCLKELAGRDRDELVEEMRGW